MHTTACLLGPYPEYNYLSLFKPLPWIALLAGVWPLIITIDSTAFSYFTLNLYNTACRYLAIILENTACRYLTLTLHNTTCHYSALTLYNTTSYYLALTLYNTTCRYLALTLDSTACRSSCTPGSCRRLGDRFAAVCWRLLLSGRR